MLLQELIKLDMQQALGFFIRVVLGLGRGSWFQVLTLWIESRQNSNLCDLSHKRVIC